MSKIARKNRRARRAESRDTLRLSLVFAGDALPTEFRLFVAGWNATEKGKILFDAEAANAVMAAYKNWGIDVPIDLEHQMIDLDGGEADPTARDARGWCKLELRNGELWACDVKWTPDGAQRLTEKRQRYVSPAFAVDKATRRVLQVVNIAITALPATHNAPALVAASATGEGMDPKLIKQALDAIQAGDDDAATEILKSLIAMAAGAEPDADGDADGSEGDGAEGVASPVEAEAVEKPKVVDASAAPPPPAKKGDDSDDDKDEDDDTPEKKAMRKTLRAALRRATGKATTAEAVAEVEVFRASHLKLERGLQKLAADRAVLESAERRELAVELVKLGAEFPATVWADAAAAAKVLKPRWAKMPLAELRSHVADQRAARGVKKTASGVRPPAGGDGSEVVELSAAELKVCADMGCEPKDFAALKRTRDGKGN